jgi:hypothetical protein
MHNCVYIVDTQASLQTRRSTVETFEQETADFSLGLSDVMLIADEVDSQLTHSVERFLSAQKHPPVLKPA